ncbi:hypothetical protein KC976_04205, partial [Candidatus Saccharibacteria bacterium]|nr:hypothetical protein [Candidatus Saccharibacteria bacterium]
ARPLTAYGLGESTDGANQLVWHALAANSSGVITDQIKGEGAPTWAHTSTLLLPDYQGVYRTIGAGEAPIVGARWVGGVPYATDEMGAPLTDWWFQCQPAYTNSMTYSNDLTSATGGWIETGASVAALDAVGLTGAPNTATTVTDDDGAAYETTRKNGAAISADTAIHTVRSFVKKDSDVSRFPLVVFELTGGTAQSVSIWLNTSTGATNTTGSVGTVAAEANDAGSWWEVIGSVQNNSTNTGTRITVYPAAGSTLGAASNAATGSCIVGNAELHLNKTIAAVRGTPAIVTAASTVTITEATGDFDTGNMVDTCGGIYLETVQEVAGNILDGFLSTTGANFQLSDGTNTATRPWTAGTSAQVGIAWDATAGTMAINVDGTWSSNATYDGSLLSGDLDIFRSPSGASKMRNLKRYRASNLAAAKALVDGDMP